MYQLCLRQSRAQRAGDAVFVDDEQPEAGLGADNPPALGIHQAARFREQSQGSRMDLSEVIDVTDATLFPRVHRQLDHGQDGVDRVGAVQGQIQHGSSRRPVRAPALVGLGETAPSTAGGAHA